MRPRWNRHRSLTGADAIAGHASTGPVGNPHLICIFGVRQQRIRPGTCGDAAIYPAIVQTDDVNSIPWQIRHEQLLPDQQQIAQQVRLTRFGGD